MFFDKLNKKEEGYHSIKETVTIKSGVYEGILRHDNVNPDSIMIVDSAGKSIDNYMLSTPEDKSWETHIKIFHDKDGDVDIFYETPGDIVDADDINKIQDYLIELSNQGGGGSGEIPQEEIDAIIKQIETIKNNKADKEHTHSADDIRETFSKNFVSMADKLKIQNIDDKADKTDIPKMVSELENDAGYITIDEVPEGGGGGTSGVSSVNGKSGKVTLTGEDIKATSGLFKPSVAEELDRLDSNIDKKADKNETQKQLDNKVERVNNMSGKYITLYGNFIDTEWGSEKSITDAIKEKADKDDVVTSVNRQTGDVVLSAHDIRMHRWPLKTIDNQITEMVLDISDLESNKADKDSVVTSVNGQTGDVVVEGGISKVNSVNGQTGDVVLDGSNINVELGAPTDVIAITTTNIGGYGYIDSVVDTDSVKDKDLLLWDLSDMTNEDPFVKLDIYTNTGDKLVSSANIKNEHNVSLRQNELYGYDNVLLEYQADNGNLHVREYNTAPKGVEVKRLNDVINNKADKDEVVTSINGQKGDVVIEGGSGGGVTSINGETGSVELDANKIPYSKWSTVKDELDLKANTWDLLDYAKKDGVVTSINGQTGDVVIESDTAGNGGASPQTSTKVYTSSVGEVRITDNVVTIVFYKGQEIDMFSHGITGLPTDLYNKISNSLTSPVLSGKTNIGVAMFEVVAFRNMLRLNPVCNMIVPNSPYENITTGALDSIVLTRDISYTFVLLED